MNRGKERKRVMPRLVSMVLACILLIGGMTVGASAAEVQFPSDAVRTRVYVDGVEVLPGECVILDSITYTAVCRLSEREVPHLMKTVQ